MTATSWSRDRRDGARRQELNPIDGLRLTMSDSQAICPRCGDAIEHPQRDPTGSGAELCVPCYFEEFDLLSAPERIEMGVCSGCGAVRRGETWADVGAEDYTDVAVEAVADSLSVHVDARDVSWEVEPEQVDETTVRVHATFSGVVRGRVLQRELTIPVKMGRETCDRCGRIAGDYYAATVQVRAVDRTPDPEELRGAREVARNYVGDREEKGDREAFISEMGETDDGLDVRVSTSQIGRAIAERVVDRFGGTVSDSRRLITEDGDGNRVYRMAYAVRLPPFRPGDVIDPDDGEGPVLVRSVRGNLKGRRLGSGEKYEADHEDRIAPEADLLGSVDEAEETTLVAVEDEHAVQVLDPENYRTKTIPRPDDLDTDAETVRVFKSRDGIYVIPDGDDDGEN
jgi:nonsense-mediated mRNA decay protein 3